LIYELAVYQPVPGQMPKLLARFGDRLLPSGKSTVFRPIGFWTTLSREIQQRAYLHTLMGVAGRSRDEVDGVPERPCLAQGPR